MLKFTEFAVSKSSIFGVHSYDEWEDVFTLIHKSNWKDEYGSYDKNDSSVKCYLHADDCVTFLSLEEAEAYANKSV
jgi:hypothetical protein